VELPILYECNIQSIRDLCSPISEGEPSVTNYICWLSTEVTSLPEVFVVMTMTSMCGKDMSLMSTSAKVIGVCDHLVRVIGPSTAT
jgi:hypothetical protein